MGGFRLQGTSFRIRNLLGAVQCKCMGFACLIHESVEAFLVNKEDKVLIVSELPYLIRYAIKDVHLGDIMEYEVIASPMEPNPSKLYKKLHHIKMGDRTGEPSIFIDIKDINAGFEQLLAERDALFNNITYQTKTVKPSQWSRHSNAYNIDLI